MCGENLSPVHPSTRSKRSCAPTSTPWQWKTASWSEKRPHTQRRERLLACEGTDVQAGYAAQEAYWRRQLADAPVWDLPFDSPRPPVQSFIRERETRDLNAKLCAELN